MFNKINLGVKMNKYFTIFLVSFLFLSACGKTDEDPVEKPKNPSNVSDGGQSSAVQDDESRDLTLTLTPPPTSTITDSPQLEPKAAIWVCEKESSDSLTYVLDENPSTVDHQGTDQERKRICELSQTTKGQTTVLQYAHWKKDWCALQLKKTVDGLGEQGWDCSQVH